MLRRLISLLCGLLIVAFCATAQAERIRSAAVAGSWYPGDPQQLSTYLDHLLQGESQTQDEKRPVQALISPHAGYRYSGTTAADGFRLLQGQAVKRVLLLGPAHRGWFRGLSIADVTHYQTPLGQIPLDLNAVKQLRTSDLVTADPSAHQNEHSLEMQLPFLQRVLQPGWKLIPVLVGQMRSDDYVNAAELLRPLLDGDTLVVVSSDFTHYGRSFEYQPFPLDKHTATRLEALDHGSLSYILNKDAQGFVNYKRRTGTTICGYRPIALLLQLLPPGSQGELISYATSGELMGDYQTSVSYMSIVFRESIKADSAKPIEPGDLSLEDMQQLHTLASVAVLTAARPQDANTWQHLQQLQQNLPPELNMPGGAFVTLWKDGQLRGCIGSNKTQKPLFQSVVSNGVNAALNDRRFPPLHAHELYGLEVEVSVLSQPKDIASPQDFVFGEEGVIIEKDGRSAVYLPEAVEKYGWSREQLLQRLARKAGLPMDAWKEGASFKTFRTQTFSAPLATIEH